jgi:hypothetical protein
LLVIGASTEPASAESRTRSPNANLLAVVRTSRLVGRGARELRLYLADAGDMDDARLRRRLRIAQILEVFSKL